MFCGNAARTFLPAMRVYKAENLYEKWMLGGPNSAIYGVTKSGWFDSVQFERWFFDVRFYIHFINSWEILSEEMQFCKFLFFENFCK